MKQEPIKYMIVRDAVLHLLLSVLKDQTPNLFVIQGPRFFLIIMMYIFKYLTRFRLILYLATVHRDHYFDSLGYLNK